MAKEWEKKPLFLYVSTAYVCGMLQEQKEGSILEEMPSGVAPNPNYSWS
jgi:hypothetical protein